MGIKFYKKNVYDLSNSLPTTTVTDATATNTGEDYIDLMRNRNNSSAWMTTGSNDAANTQIDINFNDEVEFDRLMVLKHNLKAFTIQYYNGSSYVDFSTAINETTNTAGSNYYSFNNVSTQQVRIIITGTQTPDDDKFINQLIFCEAIGEFTEEPEISPEFDKQRKVTSFISGKNFVAKAVGGFTCRLRKRPMVTQSDLDIVETLFDSFNGFLVSLSGGTTTQFELDIPGYRLEDVFYMACENEYEPMYNGGRFKHGVDVDIRLVEVV